VKVTLKADDAPGVTAALLAADGRTVLDRPGGTAEVAPGVYTATFKRRDFKPQTRTVTVDPGKPVTVAPAGWVAAEAELAVGLGGAEDAGVSVADAATGSVVAEKPGTYTWPVGGYEVTFTRPGAAPQRKTVALAEGAGMRVEPDAWLPSPGIAAKLKAARLESARAGIQVADPFTGKLREDKPDPPDGIPEWVLKAAADGGPGDAAERGWLAELKQIHELASLDAGAVFPDSWIDGIHRLSLNGYPPNRYDVQLARHALACCEAQNKKIQNSAADRGLKEETSRRLETARRRVAELTIKENE
jgi:hypothetical protein